MRSIAALALVWLWIGCGPAHRNDGDKVDSPPPPDACEDLRCQVKECTRQGRPETTISGTVFAPNGTLPLNGVTVYVPNIDPGFFTDGAQCARCTSLLPGDPITQTVSDPSGKFTLTNVPSGTNIPVIITIGKWRRQIKVPVVTECADTPLPAAQTSLPKRKIEGEMPKIAMVTGNCDALECLARKIGIDDSEFTNDTSDGRVHMFASNGANRTASGLAFSSAFSLWGSLDKLKQYDLAMFSCECSQRANEKTQEMMNNLKMYADLGGRVFLSHYHSVWISGEQNNPAHAPPEWPSIATCDINSTTTGTGIIDQVSNPRGSAFASWMLSVQGSTTLGQLPITEAKQTCSSINPAKAERWVYIQNGGNQLLQNFQFTTPNEALKEERCGKVVFSDMHVASDSSSTPTMPFPSSCKDTPMSPQEKALAFMFFDIASCVGPVF
jgi:hypothetical protein